MQFTIPQLHKPAPSGRLSSFSWRAFIVYCLIVLGFTGLSGISGDRYWPVQVFGYVRDIALLVALIPLPIVLWRKLRTPVVLQLFCAILLMWTPASASNDQRVAPAGGVEINVMTLNTGNTIANVEGLMDALEQSDADIVGLQEVSPATGAAIESRLSEVYPHQVVYGSGIPGKALLSKYPIVHHELLDSNPLRPDLLAEVDINGMHSTVIVAHPPPPHLTTSGVVSRPGSEEQFDSLMNEISRTDGPLLVLGDFNMTHHHDTYERMESMGLVDAFAVSGNGTGYTYPTKISALDGVSETLSDAPMLPLLRIDYIWGSSHWYPLETRVVDGVGSDHLPVMARIAIVPAGTTHSLP